MLRALVKVSSALQWAMLAVSLYQAAIIGGGILRRRPGPLPAPDPLPRIAIIVCARNEAGVIEGVISDLAGQRYPAGLLEVVVVAHNCDDDTAAIARANGARVVELRTERPGKLQAVIAGVRHASAGCDLIGVLDADARVNPDLLEHVTSALGDNACLQVETVPQPTVGWLAHGYGLDRRARNVLWWRPRERLGLGGTVSGSGFFLRAPLAREILPELGIVTEDLELTAQLYAAGHRVSFLSSTQIRVQEPWRMAGLFRQRTRWARGHMHVIATLWPALARRALRGDPRAADLAIYLLVPTRVITRAAVTASWLLRLLHAPSRLPAAAVRAGLAAEWLVPAAVAVNARLVPLNVQGVVLSVRLAVIGLMWFPIGAWALVTSQRRAWDSTPRAPQEAPDVPVAG